MGEQLCGQVPPLDALLLMLYRATCGPPVARVARPRERSFIVYEDAAPVGLGGGPGCLYLVVKRGLATPVAAKRLSVLLGSPVEPLGLKDAEATTAQLVCVRRCPRGAPELLRLGGAAWARLVGRVRRCPGAVLLGNRFTVVLEPLEGYTAREVGERLLDAASRSLPAYYAYQRFGTRRPSTHYAAATLLAEPQAGLLREVLDYPYPDESREAVECRLRLWRPPCPKGFYETGLSRSLRALRPGLGGFLASILSSALQAAVFNAYLSLRIARGYSLEETVPGERRLGDGRPAAWVPGLGGEPPGGEAGRLLGEALGLLSLPRELLRLRRLLPPRRGYWRPVYTRARGLRVEERDGLVVARFAMEKGMYATLLLREAVDPLQL